MVGSLLVWYLFILCINNGARGQSYIPTPITSDDILMPIEMSTIMEESVQLTSTIVQTSQIEQLQPTPSPTLSKNDSFGSGDIITIYGSGFDSGISPVSSVSPAEPLESTNFISSTTISPSPTNIAVTPDIIIRLRLTFSVDLNDDERTQVKQNLTSAIQDILQLSVTPRVTQETDNIFTVLIVTSSSMDTRVASGNISAIDVTLTGELAGRLRVAANIEIISITNYQVDESPTVTIDHFAFPLWQWFVYASCAIIVTTAITLLICACCYRYAWKRNRHSRLPQRRGYMYKHLLQSPHRPDEMVDFVQQPADVLEHDPAISRKVSRISFRPRGPMQLLSHPLNPEELQMFTLNPLAVYAEYSSIPSNMVTMAEVPPGAEEKNRFKDVLPNPHTRVALFLKFAVPNSDYINANYIRGYRDAPKAYIATQGPLYWTIADFWRMVWEQKCSTIIMTTGLEEKGMNKCARYWPDERIQHITSYEDLELILKRKTSNKFCTITTFHLRHKQKFVTREVTHFWFTAWPDHGVPSSARSVVEFLLKARHHLRDIPGPTVVHCSAGIGRTGVFIGAEIGMQQLEEKGEVDILKIVSTLRQDRGGMVQTKDQYLFLYQVLVEYSNYLDEVRSPYKVAVGARHGVARQSATTGTGAGPAGMVLNRQLEPPREEDEQSNSTSG